MVAPPILWLMKPHFSITTVQFHHHCIVIYHTAAVVNGFASGRAEEQCPVTPVFKVQRMCPTSLPDLCHLVQCRIQVQSVLHSTSQEDQQALVRHTRHIHTDTRRCNTHKHAVHRYLHRPTYAHTHTHIFTFLFCTGRCADVKAGTNLA